MPHGEAMEPGGYGWEITWVGADKRCWVVVLEERRMDHTVICARRGQVV
jgi:hypothetical protein